jgi:monoamine oxidase
LKNIFLNQFKKAKFKKERREFLKLSSFFILSTFLGQPARACFNDEPVIIIGAGLAGLNLAYQLSKKNIACEIYEASSRIGGRVKTYKNFNDEGMFCELGAEFIDSDHVDLMNLCKELKIEIEKIKRQNNELFYFKGEKRNTTELINGVKPLIEQMKPDMKQFYVNGKFQMPTYKNTLGLEDLDQLSLDEYLAKFKDVDEWIKELIKVAYKGEYGLEPSEQSAINLLSLFPDEVEEDFELFGESDEAWRIVGGNSNVAERLYEKIENLVPINFDCKLTSIEDNGQTLSLTFNNKLRAKTSRVVFTLPFSVLREVEGLENLDLNPRKLESIKNYGYGTNAKIILGFQDNFLNNQPTNVFTDLKMQSCWETSYKQNGGKLILTNFMGGKE